MSRVDLKVVLLGSEYVGKTSLLERYVYDRFRGNLPYQNVSNSNLTHWHTTFHNTWRTYKY
jgi:GTPase SAR1 family protein